MNVFEQQQHHRISRLLSSRARARVGGLVSSFGERAQVLPTSEAIYQSAVRDITLNFGGLSLEAKDILVFYLIAEASTRDGPDRGSEAGPHGPIDKSMQSELKGKLNSMNEQSEMTSLRLQMMMDRRSKFIEALSNIMKKISTTSDAIVQNIK